MELGAHLRELWEQKRGIAISAVIGLLAVIASLYRISLLPPTLEPRKLEIAAASTQVLIDTKKSKIIDLKATYVDFASLTTRADLLGNLMASLPVRTYIGRLIGVDATEIQAVAPVTASVPRVVIEPGSGQSATAMLASPDEYKLQIQADPTVPVLRLYTQAPTQDKAVQLANASIHGLRDYLDDVADRDGIPLQSRVRLQQFGGAVGGVVNPGVNLQIALLTFFVVFAIACCAVLFLSRAQRGWRRSSPRRLTSP